jgi:hypothetical protein
VNHLFVRFLVLTILTHPTASSLNLTSLPLAIYYLSVKAMIVQLLVIVHKTPILTNQANKIKVQCNTIQRIKATFLSALKELLFKTSSK